MIKNNDNEMKDKQNKLKKDEESRTKIEEKNGRKSFKIKFDVVLAIFLIIAVIVCIICSNIKEKKKENNTCKNEKINVNGKWIEVTTEYKPIIYLYPTEETQVNVQLGNKEQITCSYPKYTTGWNVIAQPNGDLKDIDTNKNLGLTDREAEEFIIYWLPKLEANKYNYIRFATREEIDTNMPLTITPEPDTTIRVLMEYKGLENPIEVEEQNLEKTERKGFVAVEWGGTEIK